MPSRDSAQGSIEYLMIQAAVLAVAVIVVVLSSSIFSATPDTTGITQDKSVCAISSVKLIQYNSRYASPTEASGNLRVEYLGSTFTCMTDNNPTGDVSCRIGIKDEETCMEILVGYNGCDIATTPVSCKR